MESIRQLFRIGCGPSSSHTMGPRSAAETFKHQYPDAVSYTATLYGSLAATGIGHLTDIAVIDAFKPKPVVLIWKPEIVLPFHPNGLEFHAFDQNKNIIGNRTVYSVGGGAVCEENQKILPGKSIYKITKMKDLLRWCDTY